MKNAQLNKNKEKKNYRKMLKENYLKMIKFSNKRQINKLLNQCTSSDEFKENMINIINNISKTTDKEKEESFENSLIWEKLFNLNKIEIKIKDKLSTITKLENEIKLLKDPCDCKELLDIITNKFEKDSISNIDIDRVINTYNDMINELYHFENN